MSNGKPTGMLTTGAIGSFLLALSAILMIATGSMSLMAGGGKGLGALAYLMLLLLVAGGICQGVGFLGFKKLWGGMNGTAGIFAILFPVVLLLAILVLMAGIIGLGSLQIIFIAIFITMALAWLIPGLALIKSKGNAGAGGGMMGMGGMALAIAGALLILMFGLGMARVALPGIIGQILGYGIPICAAVGHALAGKAMLDAKS